MAGPLRIFQVIDDQRIELGTLSQGDASVGREEGAVEIVLPSTAVSRQHGLFRAMRSHWFFSDTGSTNGSWINGERIAAGVWKIVRAGDLLQLADILLELGKVPEQAGAGGAGPIRSLIVFSRNTFVEEYPVPEYGRALVIGGSKADLKLDVDVHELPSLVLERRGENMCAFTIATETRAYHNGKEIAQPVTLRDRDEVRVENYVVMYSDASARKPQAAAEAREGGPVGASLVGVVSSTRGINKEDERTKAFQRPRYPWEAGAALGLEASGSGLMASGNEGAAGSEEGSGESGFDSGAERERPAPHRSAERSPFGKVDVSGFQNGSQDVNETVAIDPREMAKRIPGYEALPGRRFDPEEDDLANLYSIEDKIWLSVGILLLLSLMGLVLWWMLAA